MSTATASTEEKIEALIEGMPNPPCPQSSCHGSLETEDETEDLICQSCHCRRDGVFLYPEERDTVTDGEGDTHDERGGFYFETANYTPPYEVCSQEEEPEVYENSENVILNGGHEHAYWVRINGPEYAIDANEDDLILPHLRNWNR